MKKIPQGRTFEVKRNRKRGIALISVLLILSAMMVLTMGFATFTTTDHFISKAYNSSAVTLYLAQGGLEYVQFLIKHNMLIFPGWPPRGADEGVADEDGDGYTDPYADQAKIHQGYKCVGEAINLYPQIGGDHGEEHLVISQLSWGDDTGNWAYEILGSNNFCGTFHVKVWEDQDDVSGSPTNSRVLRVVSVGRIRQVPSGGDPTTDDYTDDNNYPIKSQRTLIMRIPYTRGDSVFKLYDVEDAGSYGTDQIYNTLLNDGWFEKYR